MKTSVFVLCLASIAWIPINAEYTVGPEYGNEEDGEVEIVISRNDTTDPVTFKVQTQNGVGTFGAIAPGDYVALLLTNVSFDAEEATISVTVTLVDDADRDPGEYFVLLLTDFSDGTEDFEAVIFIADSQSISVNCPGYLWAREHDGQYQLTFYRGFASRFGLLTFGVATRDIVPAEEEPFFLWMLYFSFGVTEMAVEGDDYTPVVQEVTFENGELQKTITIDIVDDVEGEPTKVFYVAITGARVSTCLFPAVISDDDIPDFFHCGRRESQPCLNGGTCNMNWGICYCPDGFGGPDCRLTDEPQPGCDARCGDHGTCISTGTPPLISCECHVGWAGAFCNYTSFNVKCNKNSFGICFTPYGYENFAGVMYVRGHRNDTECQLAPATVAVDGVRPVDNVNIQSWCQGFAIDLPHSGPCGDFPPIIDGSIRRHEAEFITQYSQVVYTHLDEWVTVRCEFDGEDHVYESGVVEVDSSSNFFSQQTSNQEASPVAMTMTTPGMDPDQPIPQDQVIVSCVSVDESILFDCLNIKRIDVNNAKTGDDFETVTLYDEGCVNPAMNSVFISYPAWPGDPHTECFRIVPFVFASDFNQPTVQMGIVITIGLPTVCAPLTCPSRRRRKREAEAEKVEELSYVFTIDMTSGTSEDSDQGAGGDGTAGGTGSVSTTEESSTSNMRPVIIGCGVGGGALLIALLVALCCLCRRREPKMQDIY